MSDSDSRGNSAQGEGVSVESGSCPVIGEFLRSWSDAFVDEPESHVRLLNELLLDNVGTRATAEIETKRAYMALDWLVRSYLPQWLRHGGYTESATQLAALPEIDDVTCCVAAIDCMSSLSLPPEMHAAAHMAAGWTAVAVSAGDAAGVAVWETLSTLPDGNVPAQLAVSASRAAARTASYCAATAPGIAPKVIEELQASAQDLVRRMIATGKSTRAKEAITVELASEIWALCDVLQDYLQEHSHMSPTSYLTEVVCRQRVRDYSTADLLRMTQRNIEQLRRQLHEAGEIP